MMRFLFLILILALGFGVGVLRLSPKQVFHFALYGSKEGTLRHMRETLGSMTVKMLEPLEKVSPEEMDNVSERIGDLRDALSVHQSVPEGRRLLAACQLLDEILADRARHIQRTQQGSNPNALDRVPGNWFVKDTRLSNAKGGFKPINVAEYHHNMRSGFFAHANARQWKSRADYYGARMRVLLSPPVAAR